MTHGPRTTGQVRRAPVIAVAVTAVALLVAGCGGSEPATPGARGAGGDRSGSTVEARPEPEVEVMATGFDGPTQISEGPGGTLLVAQLAGDEDAATGQVVVFDERTGERRVVLEELSVPTGALLLDDVLWVMVRRGLLRASWPEGADRPGPTEVVLEDLPSNGRSEGALTPTGDGRFLYETSGSLVHGEVEPGGGTLWVFDPTSGTSTQLASGLKNAYAQALTPDGRVLTSDVGDSRTDPPVDELNLLGPVPATGASSPGALDAGWPECRGDESSDTDAACEGTVEPMAILPVGSTPTGLAVVGEEVWVALFTEGRIVAVPLEASGEPSTIEDLTTVLDGLDGPHTLLARPDGEVWVSEHGTGRILALLPDAA
jgi:glucose/arabinose dehydrogenase